MFRLPVESVPPAYSLLVDFELDEGEGSLLAGMAVGPTQCYLAVNNLNKDGRRFAGIGDVDGLGNHQNETTVQHDPCLLHERHALRIDVKTEGDESEVAVQLDGRPLTRFQGKTERLAIKGFKKFYDDRPFTVGVGSMLGNYLFYKVELRPLDPPPAPTTLPEVKTPGA
jgi:hypothetical protein